MIQGFLQQQKDYHLLSLIHWQTKFLWLLCFFIPFSIAGDSLCIFILYLTTLALYYQGKIQLSVSFLKYAYLLFFIGVFLSTIFSNEIYTSLEYYRRFWKFLLPLIVFWILRKEQKIEFYLRPLFIIAVIMGLYGILQYYTKIDILRSSANQASYHAYKGIYLAVGSFSHHLTFGGVMLLIYPLFISFIFSFQTTFREKIIWGSGGIVIMLGAISSMGRSIWIGSIVVILILCLLHRPKITFMVINFLLIVFFIILITNTMPTVINKIEITPTGKRLSSIFSKEKNIYRIAMWEAGWLTIKEAPILGIGPKVVTPMRPHYQKVIKKYAVDGLDPQYMHKPEVGVHNIYLQNWINFGILGLIGYLLIFVGCFYYGLKALRKFQLNIFNHTILVGALAGLAGSMIAGLFENNFRDAEVQVTIFLIIGIIMAITDPVQKLIQKPLNS